MKVEPRKVVIVGGGFAGISVANRLKHSSAEITIIDRSNHHLFQPLLYQVATGGLSPGDIAAPIRAIFGKDRNIKVLMGEVKSIEAKENELTLINGNKVQFDQLVLAPGAQDNFFGHEDWKQYASGLKTLGDALQIRERILLSLEEAEQLEDPEKRQPFLTYVIIGGGPTGVETAGAIAEIARTSMRRNFRNINENEVKVYLVEAASEILNGFAKPLNGKARKMLEKLGVQVLLETPVINIERDLVHLKVGRISTPNIIWAAGIKASSLLDYLHVEQDRMGRVVVNQDLSVPGYPNIFVLGDSAHFKDEQGVPLPAMASVAKQQGQFLGRLLSVDSLPLPNKFKFKYENKGTMATVGRAKAVAEFKSFKSSGLFAWFLWSAVHILLLVGFRNRMRVFFEWIWHYLTFKRGVQLITDRTNCHNCAPNTIRKTALLTGNY
ncbi:NAD(P)/FAD-dependent oxidoreductase [Salinimicrobium sediminilitoris]|uniref:NAD(P)/FAD-dependent oxidoreductase n=1 Tax=Salinimicrobium sediminilitoris TaxID=2876715 RepID=UPI001E3F50FD|nr:NAD(P)/FAD-dependent oxidoreductase [Salinimicrobium sediminilitoris]MCC8358334.1 NAD(P)/FAD-dependent oxidoreductase [Salinimicrobium sediminilitoris]